MADFKDWIPAGQDTGAQGNGGFTDFVPTPEPTFVPEQPKVEEAIPEKPVISKKKK
jgi:hypothetical protein